MVTISVVGSDSALAQRTVCSASPVSIGLYVWKGLMLLGGCVLSFVTRNVDPAFAESKSLVFMMYNVAVLSLVVIFIQTAEGMTVPAKFMAQAFAICWCTVGNAVALIGPRAYAFWLLGDEAAMVNEGTALGVQSTLSRQGTTDSGSRRASAAAARRQVAAGSGGGKRPTPATEDHASTPETASGSSRQSVEMTASGDEMREAFSLPGASIVVVPESPS